MDQTVGIVLEFAGVPAGMGVIRYTGCEKVLSHAAEGGAFSSLRRAFAFGFGAGPTNGGSGNSLILQDENNPSPRASPYPLPSERAMINCVGRGLLSTDISLSDHNIQTPGQD